MAKISIKFKCGAGGGRREGEKKIINGRKSSWTICACAKITPCLELFIKCLTDVFFNKTTYKYRVEAESNRKTSTRENRALDSTTKPIAILKILPVK